MVIIVITTFVITYALIAPERADRDAAVLGGAAVLVLAGVAERRRHRHRRPPQAADPFLAVHQVRAGGHLLTLTIGLGVRPAAVLGLPRMSRHVPGAAHRPKKNGHRELSPTATWHLQLRPAARTGAL